ncbi:MAG TPA: ABC-type transport auxiliary lipoprotein family protein [Candidatus Angelobacter sp.]|nr:ABC-type transport auxiliary lipoprotein family protein [Candidatus Angelobacter sp.]
MNKYWRAFLLTAVIISVSLTGCMGKVKYPTYYTLNLAPPIDPPPKSGALASIAVREFQSPAYLREGPVVYLISPEEIGFYEYHRWAVDPRQAITNAIIERLRASGNFALVKTYDGHNDVDYVLTGRLDKLDEVDYEGGVKVEVALSAQVTDLHNGKTVWTNSASSAAKVEQRKVPSVVKQMSSTTDRSIEELLKSLALPPTGTARP